MRTFRHANNILVAQLDRPRVKNAVNLQVYEELIDAIREFEGDAALHALVITGKGPFFTSGADLTEVYQHMQTGAFEAPSRGTARRFMEALLGCTKIVVAAVNGPAVGIGVTLLLHCDFVFAAENATFWTPFMRIGIVPEFAASYTFPRVLVRPTS